MMSKTFSRILETKRHKNEQGKSQRYKLPTHQYLSERDKRYQDYLPGKKDDKNVTV